ncbi:hypothetical protein [Spirulina sp. 06S082]|uniref:hypothetical protein n=1 Tax=Spirulina sp. 06S082 TaxID=3110248 RepID=UPI002B1F517C|nr:hypothetical protein [Spirulina sp. 06S082]MEA5469668.1 hypothetical protein [Spirulina sp. 06S082]
MPSSQEFREALQAGRIQEAFTLALTEAVELKITTWVSSSESDTDRDRDVTVKNAVSRRSLDESKPGHRLRTSINLMQGDIENEIGDRFLNNSAYHELLRFHFTQVDKGQQIIEQNIHSLQKIFSLVTSLNNPAPDSSPGFSSEAFALTQVEAEMPRSNRESQSESTTVEIAKEATLDETPLEPEFFSSEEISPEERESGLNGDVLEGLVEAEAQIQQRRSDFSLAETELNDVLAEESPEMAIASSEEELEEEISSTAFETELPVFEVESAIESPLSENEAQFGENLEFTEDWLEEETENSLSAEEQSEEEQSETEEVSQPQEILRSPEEIWEEEVADSQTEAFIDTLFSSDDWIEEELSEEEQQPEASPEGRSPNLPHLPEQLEIEGWNRTSNLRLGEELPTPEAEAAFIPSDSSQSDLFQGDDLEELSESEEDFDLEGWEFSSDSSDSAETINPTEEESQISLAALEIAELAVDPETTEDDLEEIDNPWDTPESDADLVAEKEHQEEKVESQEEEEEDWEDFVNEEEEEEEEEDWGDFVKFVEQDLPTPPQPPLTESSQPSQPQTNSQPTRPAIPEINPFETSGNTDWGEWLDEDTEETTENSGEDAIAVAEEWDATSETDPFAVSQSDTESYTSIVEEDWEEFAIEELEPFPKPRSPSLPTPLLEETFATASVDEILGEPPELIDNSVGDFSDSELDRNWDEELFGDEFNFDISLSDEADLSSDLLEPNHNT